MGNMCEKQKWQWTAYMVYTIVMFLALALGADNQQMFMALIIYLCAMSWTAWTL